MQNLLIPKTKCPHVITVTTDDPYFYRVQDHGWLSVVGVRMCGFCVVFVCIVCVVWYVWCEGGVCVFVSCRVLCVCVEMVVRVCCECVCVWDVRFVFWCCGVLCCVVGVQCFFFNHFPNM